MFYDIDDFLNVGRGYLDSEQDKIEKQLKGMAASLTRGVSFLPGNTIDTADVVNGFLYGLRKRKKRKKARRVKTVSVDVNLKVGKGTLTFTGLNPHAFYRNIARFYNTAKIKNIFIEKGSVKLYTFFALELYTALTEMQENNMFTTHITEVDKLRYKNAARLLAENTWIKGFLSPPEDVTPVLDRKALRNINVTLFKHQEAFLDTYDNIVPRMGLRGMLVAAAPGSGKTILSLAMAECIHADKIVILCPLEVVDKVWKNTADTLYKKKPKYWLSTGKKPPTGEEKIYIIHYEYRDKFFKHLNKLGFKRKKICLILDESHNLNDMKAQRTKNYLRLVDEVDPVMVLPMSGTPLKAASMELIPTLRAIDPKFDEKAIKRFKLAFGGTITGATRLVRSRIEHMAYVVKKDDIGVPPPDKIDVFIKVPNSERFTIENIKAVLSAYIVDKKKMFAETAERDRRVFLEILEKAKTMAEYEKDEAWLAEYDTYIDYIDTIIKATSYMALRDEMAFCNEFEKHKLELYLDDESWLVFKLIKTQVKYVELKVVGMAIGNVLTRIRTEAHIAMVEQANFKDIIDTSLSKTILFFTSIGVGEALDSLLTDKGYKLARIFGDTSKNRTAEINAFTNDKKVDPMLASFRTLGTGVPLTMASTMVICELPYRDYILQQAIARIARIGQKHPTRTIFLNLDTGDIPNISNRSRDIITWANEQVSTITGIEVETALTDERFSNPDIPCFLNL